MDLPSSWLGRIERLANLRDDSLDQLLDRLEMDHRTVRIACESTAGPDWLLLSKIADHFELTLDDLIDNRIDEAWVRSPQLHESFRGTEGSRLRTSVPVIKWIENNYGAGPVSSLLRSLRIPAHLFDNPNEVVKLRLLCSLLQAAKARGVQDGSFFEMGVSAIGVDENATIRKSLSSLRDPRRLYECFFEDYTTKFETNFDYRIQKQTSNSVTLMVRPREERLIENGEGVAYDRLVSIYRWGVAAGMLQSIGYRAATATPILRANRDSPFECVRLEWENQAAIPVEWTKRSRSPSPSV